MPFSLRVWHEDYTVTEYQAGILQTRVHAPLCHLYEVFFQISYDMVKKTGGGGGQLRCCVRLEL